MRRLLLVGIFLSVGGRGMFLALGAVFSTQILGLGARDFGVALAAAGAAGVLAGLGFGYAADRIRPRQLTVIGISIEAGSLLAVPWATTFWVFTILATMASFGSRGGVSARNTYVACGFHGADGNRVRAQSRVAVNLGVGLATLAAAGVLAVGHPGALQVAMMMGSTATLAGAVLALRLPDLCAVGPELVVGTGVVVVVGQIGRVVWLFLLKDRLTEPRVVCHHQVAQRLGQ